jgi:hypothetical protein
MILFPALMVGGHMWIAVADRVPDLNFLPVCRASGPANLAGKDDMQACLEAEGAARDALAKQWSKFKPADRARCIRASTTDGGASYVEVLNCLGTDRDATTSRPTRDAGTNAPAPAPALAREKAGAPAPVAQPAPASASAGPPAPLALEPPAAPTTGLLNVLCQSGLKSVLTRCQPPTED